MLRADRTGFSGGLYFMAMVIVFAMCFILLALGTVLFLMSRSTRHHHRGTAAPVDAHGQAQL
jgi:hypothetical protein